MSATITESKPQAVTTRAIPEKTQQDEAQSLANLLSGNFTNCTINISKYHCGWLYT